MGYILSILVLAVAVEGIYILDLRRRTARTFQRIEQILKKEKWMAAKAVDGTTHNKKSRAGSETPSAAR